MATTPGARIAAPRCRSLLFPATLPPPSFAPLHRNRALYSVPRRLRACWSSRAWAWPTCSTFTAASRWAGEGCAARGGGKLSPGPPMLAGTHTGWRGAPGRQQPAWQQRALHPRPQHPLPQHLHPCLPSPRRPTSASSWPTGACARSPPRCCTTRAATPTTCSTATTACGCVAPPPGPPARSHPGDPHAPHPRPHPVAPQPCVSSFARLWEHVMYVSPRYVGTQRHQVGRPASSGARLMCRLRISRRPPCWRRGTQCPRGWRWSCRRAGRRPRRAAAALLPQCWSAAGGEQCGQRQTAVRVVSAGLR